MIKLCRFIDSSRGDPSSATRIQRQRRTTHSEYLHELLLASRFLQGATEITPGASFRLGAATARRGNSKNLQTSFDRCAGIPQSWIGSWRSGRVSQLTESGMAKRPFIFLLDAPLFGTGGGDRSPRRKGPKRAGTKRRGTPEDARPRRGGELKI
mmetsp:Transcript_6748/g.16183  ORF Transcript_6748/g.16183 Transcript_6748/m.16183 type:complete len:154 (-) Transcript_6748:559-1020(-)